MQQIMSDIQSPIKKTIYIQLCVTIEKVGIKQASQKQFPPQAAWAKCYQAYYQQQIMSDIQSPKNWQKRTIHTVMSYY